MLRMIAALACTLVVASAAWAGPVQKTQVSAAAKWVAHLDVEALLASETGKFILAEMEKQGLSEKMAGFVQAFGFDPTKDLQSVTLWGETFDPAGAVIIAQAKMDQDKLLKLLADNPNHQETKYGDHAIHQWTQAPEGKGDDGNRFGTFYSDTVVIISRTADPLKHAIDVLDGKAPSLAKEDSGLLGETPKGTFLVAAAKDVTWPESTPPQAALLKKLTGGRIVAGETDGNLFLQASVTARTEKDALQLRQMAQGALAFIQTAQEAATQGAQPPPEWVELAKGLKIGGEGMAVQADFTGPVKTIVEMIQKAAEAKKAAAAAVKTGTVAPAPAPAP